MRPLSGPTMGLASVLSLASLAAAQTPNNYEIYPDPIANQYSSTYTTRGTIAGGAGEVLLEWPIQLVAGVGNVGGSCQFVGAEYLTQDEDASTQESYSIVARADAMGMPDTSAQLLNATGLMTPLGSGITAWRVTATFATPFNAPCDKGMYVGLGLSAANWTTDGQSVHGAAYVQPAGNFPMRGDNPRSNAPKLAWNVMAAVASQPSAGFVYSFAMRTTAPVLNIGNEDPISTRSSPNGISWGAGGFFPEVKGAGRDDGLRARVRDATNNGGMAFVLLGTGSFPMGLPLAGFQGSIYLSPAGVIMSLPIWAGTIGTTTANEAVIQIAPPTSIPAPGWNVYFQAITVDSTFGNPRITNLAGVSL